MTKDSEAIVISLKQIPSPTVYLSESGHIVAMNDYCKNLLGIHGRTQGWTISSLPFFSSEGHRLTQQELPFYKVLSQKTTLFNEVLLYRSSMGKKKLCVSGRPCDKGGLFIFNPAYPRPRIENASKSAVSIHELQEIGKFISFRIDLQRLKIYWVPLKIFHPFNRLPSLVNDLQGYINLLDEEMKDSFTDIITENVARSHSTHHRHKIRIDNTSLWVQFHCHVKQENNVVFLNGLIVEDISSEEQKDLPLVPVGPNSVSEYIQQMLMSMNNYLTNILGNAEALCKNTTPSSVEGKKLRNILDSCDKTNQLSRKLLQFAEDKQVHYEETDLRNLLQDAITITRSKTNKLVKITQAYNAQEVMVVVHKASLTNLVAQIILNACEAVDEEGRITVQTDNVILDEGFCLNVPFQIKPGKYIVLTISDNGMGMPNEILRRMTDPFFTTKESHTGVGLNELYPTINQHRGAVLVQSEVCQGTRVRIYLPQEIFTSNAQSHPIKQMPDRNISILVIEKERLICEYIQDIIDDKLFNLKVMTDLNNGLELFQDNPHSFHLIILNTHIGDHKGINIFRRLRKLNPTLKSIYISDTIPKDETECILSIPGVLGVATKPFKKGELASLINKSLSY